MYSRRKTTLLLKLTLNISDSDIEDVDKVFVCDALHMKARSHEIKGRKEDEKQGLCLGGPWPRWCMCDHFTLAGGEVWRDGAWYDDGRPERDCIFWDREGSESCKRTEEEGCFFRAFHVKTPALALSIRRTLSKQYNWRQRSTWWDCTTRTEALVKKPIGPAATESTPKTVQSLQNEGEEQYLKKKGLLRVLRSRQEQSLWLFVCEGRYRDVHEANTGDPGRQSKGEKLAGNRAVQLQEMFERTEHMNEICFTEEGKTPVDVDDVAVCEQTRNWKRKLAMVEEDFDAGKNRWPRTWRSARSRSSRRAAIVPQMNSLRPRRAHRDARTALGAGRRRNSFARRGMGENGNRLLFKDLPWTDENSAGRCPRQ